MYRALVTSLILMVTGLPLFAQQVRLDAQLVDQNLQVYFLNDFNFTGNSIPTHDVFYLMIENTTDQVLTCFLSLTIRSEEYGQLAYGETNAFQLPVTPPLRITNRNLFTTSQLFSLSHYTIEAAADELKRKILALGKLPSGTYSLGFRLRTSTGLEETELLTFTISNPSTLDLIAPGNNAGEKVGEMIYTTYPLFRWESNMETFRLMIAEKIPVLHDDVSPDEIIQSKIVYDVTLKVDPTLNNSFSNGTEIRIPSTYYQYPFAGAPPLEPGKTYYWQLYGLPATSGRAIEFPGEIWAFTIADPDQALSDANLQTLYNLLLSLPIEELAALLGPGGPLEGYLPSGRMLVNGRAVTIDEMIQLLGEFQSGRYHIENIICQ